MKIGLITIAYNQPVGLQRLFATAGGCVGEFFLFLHSSHPQVEQVCTDLAARFTCRYLPYKINRGVARSWNEGILLAKKAGCDVILVANDDIWFENDDVDKLVIAAAENRDKYAVTCAGFNHSTGKHTGDHGFACFALNPIALNRVGMFDENIFPAYCEDCDYARRAKLVGLEKLAVSNTSVHHGGSSAIYSSPVLRKQNDVTHMRNNMYYKRKWGGLQGAEAYTRPFNDERFTCYIDPKDRSDPYPGYGRTDQGIVRI
jgi:GT2 family glycosyltransferase